MTSNPQLAELCEKTAVAIRDEDCCGLSLGDEHVFCDDSRVGNATSCACKDAAVAAILTILEELSELPSDIQTALLEPHFSAVVGGNITEFEAITRALLEQFKKKTSS